MTPRHIGIAALSSAAFLALAGAGAHAAGFYINATASAPKGLWRVSPIAASSIAKGDLVSICPPALHIVEVMRGQGYLEPGDCPGAETVPLLKPIVATQGDSVVVTREQITVNDRPLPNSEAQRLMPAYPAGHYHVRAGEVWIVSSYSPGSFDSRYFGPVPLSNVRGEAKPVAIVGNTAELTISGDGR